MTEEQRKSLPANQGDIENLQGQINEIRERVNIRHSDHENRLLNLETIRMTTNVGILVMLCLNVAIGVYVVWLLTK